jgi:hypothetical protein
MPNENNGNGDNGCLLWIILFVLLFIVTPNLRPSCDIGSLNQQVESLKKKVDQLEKEKKK